MKLFKSINKFLPFTIIFFTSLSTAHADFIKGVTYFGDAWPINFWNSDLSKVDQDFKK